MIQQRPLPTRSEVERMVKSELPAGTVRATIEKWLRTRRLYWHYNTMGPKAALVTQSPGFTPTLASADRANGLVKYGYLKRKGVRGVYWAAWHRARGPQLYLLIGGDGRLMGYELTVTEVWP